MKAKRFFSVIVALMLVMSCFAISASAETAIYDNTRPVTLNIHLYSGSPSTDTAGKTKTSGEAAIEAGNLTSDNKPIANAIFEITDSTGTEVATVKTDSTGLAKITTTAGTSTDYAKYGLALPRDTYTVTQTELGATQTTLLAAFSVDLPMTNTGDNDFLYTVDVYPKVLTDTAVPEVTKSVQKGTTGNFEHSQDILAYSDEVATWKIETKGLPSTIATYKTLTFVDSLDNRLTFNNDVKVTVIPQTGNSFDLTKDEDYTVATKGFDNATKLTVNLVANTTGKGIKRLTTGSKVQITYTTTIKRDASTNNLEDNTIATKIGNHVVLKYQNNGDVVGYADNTPDNNNDDPDPDPNNPKDPEHPIPDPTGDNNPPPTPTPDDNTDGKEDKDPYIWTGKLDFTKIKKGDENTKLNAEFDLYRKNSENQFVRINTQPITTTDGTYSLQGLDIGEYYLKETKAPGGYELIGEKIQFSITGFADANVKFTKYTDILDNGDANTAPNDNIAYYRSSDAYKTNYVVNIPSQKLPLTGGTGVVLFAVLGLALAALGVSLFKSKRYE